jgi:hypothetical protein
MGRREISNTEIVSIEGVGKSPEFCIQIHRHQVYTGRIFGHFRIAVRPERERGGAV